MKQNDEPLIECRCGKKWWIDYDPTPEGCEEDIWRIWSGDFPGSWVDVDGNYADPAQKSVEKEKPAPKKERVNYSNKKKRR